MNKEDKDALDRLFDRAQLHTSAAVYMSHPWPITTILLSIILEHEKMIGVILRRLKERNV